MHCPFVSEKCCTVTVSDGPLDKKLLCMWMSAQHSQETVTWAAPLFNALWCPIKIYLSKYVHQLPSAKHCIYLHIPTNLQLQKIISWEFTSFLVLLFLNGKNLVSNDVWAGCFQFWFVVVLLLVFIFFNHIIRFLPESFSLWSYVMDNLQGIMTYIFPD